MSLIDIVIGFAIAGALGRGYQMGLSHELERLVKVGIALLGSLGLFRFAREALQNITGMESGLSGFVGFVGSFALVWWVVRFVRKKLRSVIEVKFGTKMKPAGAVVGAVHAVAVTIALLAGLVLADWSFTNKLVLKHSKVAAVAADLVGREVPGETLSEKVEKKFDKLKDTIKERSTNLDLPD